MPFPRQDYTYELGEHDGKDVIWIHFPKDTALIEQLRQHTKARWSQSRGCWYVQDVVAYRALFGMPLKSIGKDAIIRIGDCNRQTFIDYEAALSLKGYSPNTVKTYLSEFAQFLHLLAAHPASDLSPDRLKSYFLYCINQLKLSENQIHSRINALKFYYEQVLHRPKMFLDIPRPKKPSLLPEVLNTREIKRLFSVTTNPKHLLMLKLCYGMGLRVSEITALKVEHIDSQRMQVLIKSAKGKKDRYVNLPESILNELRAYYTKFQPKEYLFEGQYGGAYSRRSAQAVFKEAMQKAKIRKQIGIHGLRHSYATHLLESGTDICFIQKLLGHKSIKTTQIYTHVTDRSQAKVKSPLDSLDKP